MGFGSKSSPAPQPVEAKPEPAGAPATDQNIQRPVRQNRFEGTPQETHLLGDNDDGESLLKPRKGNTY